jgi:predicted Zn-dependent protease
MRWFPLVVVLASLSARAEGEQCLAVEDPAGGAPVCRHSKNPLGDIQRVFEPLWQASGYGKRVKLFFLEQVHEPNAFALAPGVKPNNEPIPKVVVSVGMWDLIQSDDELAFVLAHEMGHLANLDGEHLVKTLPKLVDPWMNSPRGKKIQDEIYAREDLTEDQKSSLVVEKFKQLVINPRKTAIEQMADVNALNLLAITTDADGNPVYDMDAAISFLNRVKEYHPEHDKVDPSNDHPVVSERIKQAEDIRIGYYALGAPAPKSATALDRVGQKSKGRVRKAAARHAR